MKPDTISRKIVLIGLLTILLCFTGGTIAWAAIPQKGIQCSACHGGGMDKPLLPQYQGNQGCVNCHSSSTSSTTYELDVGMGNTVTVPVVYYTGALPPTQYLAGGNFWWVKEGLGGDDTKGHNIFPGEPDNHLDLAPGDPGPAMGCGWDTACHRNLHTTNDMSMPGLLNRQACTKCHMLEDFSGPTWEGDGSWHSHHRDDSNLVVGSQTYDGNSDGGDGVWDPEDGDGYFRFLRGHQGGDGHGVCGIEDPDWQSTSSSTDHNEYLGFSGSKTSSGSLSALGHTVTGFCCGCHGNFHIEQKSGGGWIRHASDGALCPDGLDGCECADYIIYDAQIPVARPSLDGWTQPSETVNPETDMAMCLSCHRAHGSPYPKMLRWDFSGCLKCHVNK